MSWTAQAKKQGQVLAAHGLDATSPASIATLIAESSSRVTLALLDRDDHASPWRRVFVSARIRNGQLPDEWCLGDEFKEPLDEPPDTPGGVLKHNTGDHSLVNEMGLEYYVIATGDNEFAGPAGSGGSSSSSPGSASASSTSTRTAATAPAVGAAGSAAGAAGAAAAPPPPPAGPANSLSPVAIR